MTSIGRYKVPKAGDHGAADRTGSGTFITSAFSTLHNVTFEDNVHSEAGGLLVESMESGTDRIKGITSVSWST
jgi:hypothetical protein